MPNLDVWNRLAQPPASALKTIGAGRLKGKTDVNPQSRYHLMTEEFGICGFGWKFTIDKLWTEPGDYGEVFAFAAASVYVKMNEEWSEPIPGIGGHKLRESETKGIHNNDEGFKMAVTDALGTAMKMLGVAADVYAGRWDGSKYATPSPTSTPPPASGKKSFGGQAATSTKPFSWSTATSAQRIERVVERITEARKLNDPIQGLNKLKELGLWVNNKSKDLEPADIETIRNALLGAEQDLNAECSGTS